jgi:N6-L-threonylcarbamoyladenine synthase
VLEVNHGKIKILSSVVSSQITIHKKYGGVVPEVAARKHAEVIFDVIKKALSDANKVHDFPLCKRGIKGDFKNPPQPSFSKGGSKMEAIDLIAATYGPGLVTSLRVGVLAAETLANLANIPFVGVNHIEAHLLSPFLTSPNPSLEKEGENKFPAMGLIVSGGHTELILVKDFGKYKLVGSTRDDAVGEAFDKVAKILNLGYPGGPAIAREAAKYLLHNAPQPPLTLRGGVKLPRPMMDSDDFDFSFSGLKTAVLYLTKKMSPRELKKMTPAIAAEFQRAAVEVLVHKTKKAAEKFKVQSILVGGGVSANQELRRALKKLKFPVYLPEMKFTGDNAAMIAFAGYQKYLRDKKNEIFKIVADANLTL